MDLSTVKFTLENEVKNPDTDIQRPLNYKYPSWKIIEYLWVSYQYKVTDGECIEWLKDLYQSVGMDEANMCVFVHEVELMLETIRRNPFKKV